MKDLAPDLQAFVNHRAYVIKDAKVYAQLKELKSIARAVERWVAAPDLHSTVGPTNSMVNALKRLKKASAAEEPK